MPKKHLGQHFLTDRHILRRIVDFAGPSPDDTVVEIGPGRGALTRLLAERARKVIAIEVDPDFIEPLRERMPPNVSVVERDALAVDFASLSTGYSIVANLPYNISTPLLDRIVRSRSHISRVTVLVQKEVADRILSPPRAKTYGPLSVGIQHYASPRSGFLVPPGAFRPPPKVHSRLIGLDWRTDVSDDPDFIAFVGRAFGARRKKLINNLFAIFPDRPRAELEDSMATSGLGPDVRPENLSPGQFFTLWKALKNGP